MPRYDFSCDQCGSVHEIKRPMAQASDPVHCPACAAPMVRIYDVDGTAIIMRPWGYATPYGHPDYWTGFDAPVPAKRDWQKSRIGRTKKADPARSPQFVGVGDVHKS